MVARPGRPLTERRASQRPADPDGQARDGSLRRPQAWRAPTPPAGTVEDEEGFDWCDPEAEQAMEAEASDLDDRELRDAKSWDA